MHRLWRVALTALALIAGMVPAMAQNTNAQLLSLIAGDLPSGALTPIANFRTVLNAMVNSTNVASGSCPTTALSTYQPWANTTNAPSAAILNVFDGTSCVPWAVLNNSTHALTFIGSALPTPRNLAARFGSMDVFQRGAGGSASIAVGASSTAYTVDGCYLTTGANEASTVTASTPLTSQSNKSVTVARNAAQTGTATVTFGCPLDTDELIPARGNFVTLSFYVQAGANWSPVSGAITANVLCGTGTPVKQTAGYTNQSTIASTSNNLTPGGSVTRFQVTSSAVVPTNCAQMEVQWTWGPTGTAGANDSVAIDSVQLEIVPAAQGVASAFQEIDFGTQLGMAQRHFAKTFAYGTAPAQNAGANTGELQGIAGKAGVAAELLHWRYPRQMRVTPTTVTLFNPSVTNAQVRDETAAADTSASTNANTTADGLSITATGNAGTAVGNTLGVHITVDAGI